MAVSKNILKATSKVVKVNASKLALKDLPKKTPKLDKPIKVNSSNIKTLAYNRNLRQLTATFLSNNSTYVYFDVPPVKYSRLLVAASIGKFFHKYIRYTHKYNQIS